MEKSLYKISFYVPETDIEEVKAAMFDAGAGKVGSYDHCSWQIKGEGQFLPCHGSNPSLGGLGSLEIIEEYKVEMVCAEEFIEQVIIALKREHPYEEPVYSVIRLEKH